MASQPTHDVPASSGVPPRSPRGRIPLPPPTGMATRLTGAAPRHRRAADCWHGQPPVFMVPLYVTRLMAYAILQSCCSRLRQPPPLRALRKVCFVASDAASAAEQHPHLHLHLQLLPARNASHERTASLQSTVRKHLSSSRPVSFRFSSARFITLRLS